MKDNNVLNSFNSLRKSSKRLQTISAFDILHHLWTKQNEYGLEEPCKELRLGIVRIVRGLGAPRLDSRRGYFLTFVNLCELFSPPTFTIPMVLDAINKELHDFSTKGEESDVYKGKILAYGGLIYSGKILQANHKEIHTILTQLITVGNRKSYLMLAAHAFLINLIEKVDETTFKQSMWSLLKDKITMENKGTKSLQWYHLLFVLSKKYPSIIDQYLIELTGHSSIFHKSNIESIGKSFLNLPHALVHVDLQMYEQMLSDLVNTKNILEQFWLLVDESLASTTPEMIIYVFKLFICCVQKLDNKDWIEHLLTPNVVKVLGVKSSTNSLESVRLDTIKKLSEIISKELLKPKTQKVLIQKLLFNSGSFDFLQGPGVKIFQALASSFNEETVKFVVKYFSDVLGDNGTNTTARVSKNSPCNDHQRGTACKIIIKLLNHSAVISCIDWKVEQMKKIVYFEFFSKTVSQKLSKVLKMCFFSALDFKFVKLSDMCLFLKGLVVYMNSKLNGNDFVSIDFSKEMKNAWKKMLVTVNAIESESGNTDNKKLTDTVFRAMFLLLGLTIFIDSKSAIENLEELHKIYEKMCSAVNDRKRVKTSKEELHWTDVVVDLFLSLLSYDRHFHRNVIAKVFHFLCPHLSPHNIHQILTVLNPNEDNVLSAEESKTLDDDNESSTIVNRQNNCAVSAANNEESDLDEIEEDNNSEESDLDEIEEDNNSEESGLDEIEEDNNGDKLRATLREALEDDNALTDTESINVDDLNEEEAKKLDDSLAKAFKQMKEHKSKSHSTERRQLSNFRIRVIDLLEIWLKSEPELNLVFDVVVIALMLLENTLQNRSDLPLGMKLKSFIKQLTSVKRFSTNEKLNAHQLVELMKKLIDKDEKTMLVYINMSQQIVECCTFILKISLKNLKSDKQMSLLVLETYKKALHNFFNKKNCIVPVGLFKSAFALPWEGSFDLIKDVADYSLRPVTKQFHLSHAFNMLQIFLHNKRLLNAEICNNYKKELCYIAKKLVDNVHILEEKPDKLLQFIEVCQMFKKLDVVSHIMDKINLDLLRKNHSKRKSDDSSLQKSVKKGKKCLTNNEDADDLITIKSEETVNQQINTKKQRANKRKIEMQKKESKLKKQRKFTRAEELSKGIEEEVFGLHLYDSSYNLLSDEDGTAHS